LHFYTKYKWQKVNEFNMKRKINVKGNCNRLCPANSPYPYQKYIVKGINLAMAIAHFEK